VLHVAGFNAELIEVFNGRRTERPHQLEPS
jgi:hypothetical protein